MDRSVFYVEKGFNWQEFSASAQCLSLFSNKRIIELRLSGSSKLGVEGSKSLLSYMKHFSSENIVLVLAEKLDRSITQSEWFKMAVNIGAHVAVWPILTEALPNWIRLRLKAVQLEIDEESLAIISKRVEGNLLAAAQEVMRLRVLINGNSVDLETVSAVVSGNARYDVYNLLDAVLKGDVPGSIQIFKTLRTEGVDITIVLWAVVRDLRLLSSVARECANGISLYQGLQQAAKLVGISPYFIKKRQSLVQKALNRHSEADLRKLLVEAGALDQLIKGMEKGDPWHVMLNILLRLAGFTKFIHLNA